MTQYIYFLQTYASEKTKYCITKEMRKHSTKQVKGSLSPNKFEECEKNQFARVRNACS